MCAVKSGNEEIRKLWWLICQDFQQVAIGLVNEFEITSTQMLMKSLNHLRENGWALRDQIDAGRTELVDDTQEMIRRARDRLGCEIIRLAHACATCLEVWRQLK